MLPVIKKLYDKKEDQSAALERHMELFNTTPAMVPAIMGITVAMEEQNANNPDFDANSIGAIKTSLMGPFAGIGDSLFWGTFRIIAAGIGISLATQGNMLGPILFLILYNVPNFIARIFGLTYGYKVGVSSLERIQKNGMMDAIMAIATIVGMCVVGGMVATMLNISTPLVFNVDGAEVVLQDVFDAILPKLLPLAYTFGIYGLMKKKVSVTKLTLGTIVLGIALHAANIL